MSIILFTNKKNNRIIGYNKVVKWNDRVDPDVIIYDETKTTIEQIEDGIQKGSIFYINGEIVESDPDTGKTKEEKELESISSELLTLSTSGKNEYEDFMKDLIETASFDTAISNAKKKKNRREELSKRNDVLREKIQKAEEKAYQKQLKKSIPTSYKYFLSGITTVRDEDNYLVEWLCYHIEEMGFDHFYIYDNESKCPVEKLLEDFPYPEKITVIEWPTTHNLQRDTNNHFLMNFRNESKWIINFDPDEYVVLADDLTESLATILENTSQPCVMCKWRHFGASGREKKEDGTDMERFSEEVTSEVEKYLNPRGYMGKQFIQSAKVAYYNDHYSVLRKGFRDEMPEDMCRDDLFRLNHYITRSYEEWVDKINRGSITKNHSRRYQDFFVINPNMQYLNTGENHKQSYSPQRKDDE